MLTGFAVAAVVAVAECPSTSSQAPAATVAVAPASPSLTRIRARGTECSRTRWTNGGPPVREVRCSASFAGDEYECNCLVADVSIGVCHVLAEDLPPSDNPCNACDPDDNCCNALFDGDGG